VGAMFGVTGCVVVAGERYVDAGGSRWWRPGQRGSLAGGAGPEPDTCG
jgi:hypothetical protein